MFQDGGARKFKSGKPPSQTPIGKLTRQKNHFFLYAADLSYVQRAFWMQLVKTAEDPFNRIYMASLQLMTVCHSS